MNRRNAIMAIAGASLGLALNTSQAEIKCKCGICEDAYALGSYDACPHEAYNVNVAGRILAEYEPNFVVVKVKNRNPKYSPKFYFINKKVFNGVNLELDNCTRPEFRLESYSDLVLSWSGQAHKFRHGKLFDIRWEGLRDDMSSFYKGSNKLKSNYKIYS